VGVGTCHLDHLSFGLSICPVNCGKIDDWIWMRFGMICRLGPRMKQVDGVGDCPTRRAVLGVDMGRPIVTNGDFMAYCQYLCKSA